MSKYPMKFVASKYTNQIRYRRLSKDDERYPRGTFHDTWEEAHAAIVERCHKIFNEADRKRNNAQASLAKAKAMKPPADKGEKE